MVGVVYAAHGNVKELMAAPQIPFGRRVGNDAGRRADRRPEADELPTLSSAMARQRVSNWRPPGRNWMAMAAMSQDGIAIPPLTDTEKESLRLSLTTESAAELEVEQAETGRVIPATLSTRVLLKPRMYRYHTIPEALNDLEWRKLQSIVCMREIPIGVLRLPFLRELIAVGVYHAIDPSVAPGRPSLPSPEVAGLTFSVGALVSLQTLDFRSVHFESMLDVNHLSRLKRFTLNDCIRIGRLPTGLTQLTGLVELNVSQCGISELPDDIGRMTGLRVLRLGGNHIDELPTSISDITSLRVLSLQHNFLGRNTNWNLPANLRVLDLSYNRLSSCPDQIAELFELRDLGLSGNVLRRLPRAINRLTNLVRLRLGSNLLQIFTPLRGLPYDIWRMHSLRILDISNNYVVNLQVDKLVMMSLSHLICSANMFGGLDRVFNEEDTRRLALNVTLLDMGKLYHHEDMFNLTDFE